MIITEVIWNDYFGFEDEEETVPNVPFPSNVSRLEMRAIASFMRFGVLSDYDSLSEDCQERYRMGLMEQMITEDYIIQYGIDFPNVLKYVAIADYMYTQDRDNKSLVNRSAINILVASPCKILNTDIYLVGCRL